MKYDASLFINISYSFNNEDERYKNILNATDIMLTINISSENIVNYNLKNI